MTVIETIDRNATLKAMRMEGSRQKPADSIRLAIMGIFLGDAAIIMISAGLAWQLRLRLDFLLTPSDSALSLATSAGPEIVLAWLAIAFYRGCYSKKVFGAGPDEYRAVVSAALFTAGLTGLFCYLTSTELSRGFVFLTFVFGTAGLLVWRWGARMLIQGQRTRGRFVHRVVAVGGADSVQELTDVFRRESNLGYEVIGACMPGSDIGLVDVPRIGSVQETREVCAFLGADAVVVTAGAYENSADLRQIAWDLQGSDVELIVAPSLTDVAGPRIHMRPVAGLPLLHLQEPQADEAGGFAKRFFDMAGSLVAILLLSPVLLTVALLVKLEDGGPVFFKQRRVGFQGDDFLCMKFRSMSVNAEKLEKSLREADGHDGTLWKMENDPRVTRIGRVIRRFSLDELPQLFNVFGGSMSLVGPRPQQGWEVETYSNATRRRLLVRPGMTGLWQVSGRSDLTEDEAVRLDLYYVDNWSMTTDLVIMAKTVRAVFQGSGAY